MVDAIVSAVLEQLVSVAVQEAKQELRLVCGLDQEVEKLKSNFRAIKAVLADAERRQHKEEAVRLWLDDLKQASYDMEDVLDEWITIRLKRQIQVQKKVCSFFPATSCFGCKHVFWLRNIALKIKSINQTLDEIAKRKDRFDLRDLRSIEKPDWKPTTSFIDVSEVRGRDKENETIKSKLLCESSEQQKAFQIISIVGMGGIGKTTLAQFAYNDTEVINNFEKMMWVCVSEPFEQFRIARAIVEALEGTKPDLDELQSLLQRIRSSIVGKKFFLVLDDVWTEDRSQWEPFYNCLANGGYGSKMLVTTRKESVAQMMESIDVIYIKELSEKECWLLFKRFAFFERSPSDCEQLQEIGRKIVDKCKGLPLAIKTMGSMLSSKSSRKEWESILESELWHLEEVGRDIFRPLLLSYNDLPSKIKQCFSYCAVFQKDYDIEKDELIRLWMAQGYISPEGNKEMEMVGEEYFNCLALRSFFQEFRKDYAGTIISCKMHDLVHDFAQFLTKNECFTLDSNNPENPCFEKLRHLTLLVRGGDKVPNSIFKAKKLRSLLIIGDQSECVIPRDIFDQLTCLRTLKIDGGYHTIKEIPKEIKELTHLRYLKLDRVNGIKKLPKTCCELINLQTMEMTGYHCNIDLPQGMGKLVNLRHLISENVPLKYTPEGKERLLCLGRLSKFVGISRGVDGREAWNNLDVLKDLNQLRLSIRIGLIVNVRNVDEAKNVELEKMENLVGLELDFCMFFGDVGEYEAVCDALRPPQNLESLEIGSYAARNRWPKWIVSLHKLKELTLRCNDECEIMPPLGKLPSLEMLQICELKRVKRVGDEFLGIEERDEEVHGATSSSVTAFPKLKQLSFRTMLEWQEWDFEKEDIEIMPQLNYLRIEHCRELRLLPEQLLRSKTLKTLEIRRCRILEECFKKDTGEDWPMIAHIPNIQVSSGINLNNQLWLMGEHESQDSPTVNLSWRL